VTVPGRRGGTPAARSGRARSLSIARGRPWCAGRTLLVAAALLLGLAVPSAAQRPPLDVTPLHYQLTITPDFGTGTFDGDLTIDLRVDRPTTTFSLDAVELEIYGADILVSSGRHVRPAYALDRAAGTLTFTAPARIYPGTIKLHVEYGGKLRSDGRGFYLVRSHGRKYLLSQMEATDARRAFPCFDDPSLKASFALSAVIEDRLTAVSNGRVVSDSPSSRSGRHVVRFGTTPRMSTYLVALLVGEFGCVESTVDTIPVRVCAVPERKGELGFVLEAAQRALHFDNQYFTVKYPFRKLDLVGVPGHFPGAMENSAAIVFDEDLLSAPGTASESERTEVALTVSHEIAHQWLGDIVTPRGWDDLWLSEGLATWMAPKALTAWKPEWQAEVAATAATRKAMELDAFRSTRSVRWPAASEAEIEESFDAIAYEKAAAVVRMVEAWVGADAFRSGVNAYVRAHAYQNATGEDFWTELTAAAIDRPVEKVMEPFITRPGLPLVSIETSCDGNETVVTASVRRFGADPASGGEHWVVPLNIRGLDPTSPMLVSAPWLLTEPWQTLRIGGCFPAVLADSGAVGYFRTAYTTDALASIVGLAPNRLTPAERIRLLDDQWALAAAGGQGIGQFLSVAAALAGDASPEVVEAAGARLVAIGQHLARGAVLDAYAAWIRATFGPAARALGWHPARTETSDRKRLRAALLTIVGAAGRDPSILASARALVAGHATDAATLDVSVVPTASRLAALSADRQTWDILQTRDTREALGAVGEPGLAVKTLEDALEKAADGEALPGWIAAGLNNPAVNAQVWGFVKTRWPALQPGLLGAFALSEIVSAAGSFCDGDAREDVRRFFADKTAAIPRTLSLTLERIDACRDLRLRQDAQLADWLRTK
jgi:aminopeptidase N